MGQNMPGPIPSHWDNRQFVPNARRFLGKAFITGRGVTQGDPASPMIFNIVVDAVVRAVVVVVCGPQESHHGMGWVVEERNLVFCTDYGRIAGRDHIWLQDALMVKVEMFSRVDLETNLEKKKLLVCTPGYIRGKWSEDVYKRRATGEGETFRERKWSSVNCAECVLIVAA